MGGRTRGASRYQSNPIGKMGKHLDVRNSPTQYSFEAPLITSCHLNPANTLNINIAKLSIQSTSCCQQISQSHTRRIISQIHTIIQCCIRTRWFVLECKSSRYSCETIREILELPDPPNSIDHAVMQEESWITRRSEEVPTWIPTDCEIATSMYTPFSDGEDTLYVRLEPIYIRVLRFRNEGVGIVCRRYSSRVRIYIAAETARIGSESVSLGVRWDPLMDAAMGPRFTDMLFDYNVSALFRKVEFMDVLFEMTSSHTSSPYSRGDYVVGWWCSRNFYTGVIVV